MKIIATSGDGVVTINGAVVYDGLTAYGAKRIAKTINTVQSSKWEDIEHMVMVGATTAQIFEYRIPERIQVSREWEDLNCDGSGMTISDADDGF